MTVKERLFVNYYLGKAGGNGTEAARLAKYKHPRQIATQLLSKLHIREAIENKVSTIGMEADEVLERLARLARVDGTNFLTFSTDKKSDEAPKLDLRKAKRKDNLCGLKEITETTRTDLETKNVERELKVKIEMPIKALELFMKFHGMLVERAQIDVKQDVALKQFEKALEVGYGNAGGTLRDDGEAGGVPA